MIANEYRPCYSGANASGIVHHRAQMMAIPWASAHADDWRKATGESYIPEECEACAVCDQYVDAGGRT